MKFRTTHPLPLSLPPPPPHLVEAVNLLHKFFQLVKRVDAEAKNKPSALLATFHHHGNTKLGVSDLYQPLQKSHTHIQTYHITHLVNSGVKRGGRGRGEGTHHLEVGYADVEAVIEVGLPDHTYVSDVHCSQVALQTSHDHHMTVM